MPAARAAAAAASWMRCAAIQGRPSARSVVAQSQVLYCCPARKVCARESIDDLAYRPNVVDRVPLRGRDDETRAFSADVARADRERR